jgi:hypothetical protein
VGILVGWIIQKRWLTMVAFFVLFVGSFTLTRLPAPFSYLVVLLPALFLMAVLYEGTAHLGLRLTSRVRLAWAVWMGFSAAVLMAGFVLGGSSQIWFVGSVTAFVLLTMPSIIVVGQIHRRKLREEQSTGSNLS